MLIFAANELGNGYLNAISWPLLIVHTTHIL